MEPRARRLFEFGSWCLDPWGRILVCSQTGRPVPLAPKAVETLVVLVENRGRVVTKEELMRAVWPDTFVEEAGLARNISVLRKALGETEEGSRYIETIPKRGYRFVASVKEKTLDSGIGMGTIPSRLAEPEIISAQEGTRGAVEAPRRFHVRAGWLVAGIVLMAVFLVSVAALIRARSKGRAMGRGSAPHIDSLAVLPFENFSRNPEEEYLADGMTDELITELAKIQGLRVISRTSVMQYKGARKRPFEIAGELNVDGLVEGSVLRSGNRIRVTAQLIRATSEDHVWAERYERDFSDILSLQAEVAGAIANQIQIKLMPQVSTRLASPHPVNPEAYEAYLRGRQLWSGFPDERLNEALRYFKKAIALDSEYAPAHAGLAYCYSDLGLTGAMSPDEVFPPAKSAAERALGLDSSLGEAHAVLADLYFYADWNWQGAETEYRRAIELNPSSDSACAGYACYLFLRGRPDEAFAEIKRGRATAPLSNQINQTLAYLLYLNHEYDKAIAQSRQSLELYPGSIGAHALLAGCYDRKGMYREAVEEDLAALTLAGVGRDRVAALRSIFRKSGIRAYWREELRRLVEESKHRYIKTYDFAELYALLGDKEQALKWLEKACEKRSCDLVQRIRDPHLDNLHAEPRYQALLRRIGLRP